MSKELTAKEIQSELEATIAAIEESKLELARLEADEPTDDMGLTRYVQTEARVALLRRKHTRLKSDLAQAILADLTTVEEQAKAANDAANDAARKVREVVEKEVRRDFDPHFETSFDDIVRCHKRVIESEGEARLAHGRLMEAHRAVRSWHQNPSMT